MKNNLYADMTDNNNNNYDNTCYENIKQTAERYPDNIALVFYNIKITYKQLLDKIDSLAYAFIGKGIGKKDGVTIMLPNIPENVICLYALNKIGAVACLMHPLLSEYEIRKYIDDLSADNEYKIKAIITLDNLYDKVQEIVLKSDIEFAVICSLFESCTAFYNVLSKSSIYKFKIKHRKDYLCISYHDLIGQYSKFGAIEDEKHKCNIPDIPDDVNNANTNAVNNDKPRNEDTVDEADKSEAAGGAVIIHSGGSASGYMKGILLSSDNLNTIARQIYILYKNEIENEDISMLAVLPMFHAFGLGVCIHAMLSAGARVILVPRFKPEECLRKIRKHKISFIAGVPTFYEALLSDSGKNAKNIDLSYLRGAFSGGDVLPCATKVKFNEFVRMNGGNIILQEGYGLSETSGVCCLSPREDIKNSENSEVINTIGLPMPGMEIKIFDIDTGKECRAGDIGEICVRGKSVMLRYINSVSDNERAFREHGGEIWLHTGDMGYMDRQGYFYFSQRLKRVIKVSGYGVYPRHVEDVINNINGVDKCCVIGVSDDYYINKVKVFIKADAKTNDKDILKENIIDECREKLSYWSRPKIIEFIDKFPLTRLGKIDYSALE